MGAGWYIPEPMARTKARLQHSPISVIIADDHPVALHGLEQVLRRNDIDVLASCNNGYSALEAIRKLKELSSNLGDGKGQAAAV